MKRIVPALVAVIAALAVASSCTVKEPDGSMTFKFVREGFEFADATKVTSVKDASSVSSTWDEGDAIGVFPDLGGSQVAFIVTSGAGTSNCVFDGAGWGLVTAATYSAYYPYNKNNYGDNARNNVAVSYVGQSQTAKNTFGVGQFDYMASTNATPVFADANDSGSCTFTFSHLGALLILNITFPTAATLSTLELICSESLFPQAGTVDLAQATPAITPTALDNSLTLDLGGMSVAANETVTFYMMSAPANLTGSGRTLTAKATTTAGAEMTKTMSKPNIRAGYAYQYNITLDAPVVVSATLKAQPGSFFQNYQGRDITFRVTSTESYTMTPAVSWITKVSETTISETVKEYTYHLGVNNVSDSRNGYINITGETLNKAVYVSQTGLTLHMPDVHAGHTIYTTTGMYKYRYGPSIIMNDDGTIDAWFSSPGDLGSRSGMADVFTYRRTSNGGTSWTSANTVVLEGTAGRKDAWSVCDPGAAHFDGYYYIAYTSTTNTTSVNGLQGLENDCFIARGTSPTGPWQKWSGSGWGSNPQPIIEYDNAVAAKFGVGEPSIVVKDNTIYLYYTYDSGGTAVTKVATADRNDPNWPGNLTFHGTAVNKAWLAEYEAAAGADLEGTYDSCDVKYVEDYDLFYAFHTSWRITANSKLSVWTSTDGLTFTYLGSLCAGSPISPRSYQDTDLLPYIHNMGVSGDGLGHVNLSRTQYVSYAYSPADKPDNRAKGEWSTYWSEITY